MTLSALKRRELVVMALCSLLHGTSLQPDGSLCDNRSSRAEQDLLMDQCKIARRWAIAAVELAHQILISRTEFKKELDAQSLEIDWKRLGRVEESILLWFLFSLKRFQAGVKEEVVLEENASVTEGVRVLISEAIRLVRKFSSRESAGYVNVLLDRYCHHRSLLTDS